MNEKPQIEIPEQVRQIAERNVEQARTAYNQLMDMARQVQSMVSKSSGAMAESAADIQALKDVGLSDAEVLDLLHSDAIFAWANRLMLNLGEPVFPQD